MGEKKTMPITFFAICVRVVKPNNVQFHILRRFMYIYVKISKAFSTTNFQASSVIVYKCSPQPFIVKYTLYHHKILVTK